jgi:integrase/recombinase XerD
MQGYSKPILGLSAIRSEEFAALLHDYEEDLVRAGYNLHVRRLHLQTLTHFGVWLDRAGVASGMIDEDTVAAFERHRPRCRCPGTSRNRGRHVVSCIRVFLGFLRKRGHIAAAELPPPPPPLVRDFLGWMKAHRGVVETTLASYRLYLTNLVSFLGEDPRTYTASDLRVFVAKRYGHYGRDSVRVVLAAVRMFLRYLAVDGRCRPGLEQTLISAAKWSQQALPRGLTTQNVEKVLGLCPTTPAGLRDRAVLLLLTRLGLRAGDVAKLRLSDICFTTGTVSVRGKGRREVRLPLPQEVGEALLEYLRIGRPQTESDRVFLRVRAPLQAFGGRQIGHAVSHIARAALKRADIQPPTRGAHVFRHTAACQMLRAGVGLEGIAEVFRHRSIETTALYAKVDLHLLEQVAQPWPEVASC